jgi:ADP-heptose:LPS heptosyltransferase
MCDVVRLPPSQGLPALELPLPKRPWFCPNEDYVTLQMTAGWSKYKEWSEAKWLAFMKAAWLFAECPPIVIIEQQVNRSLGDSVAAIANARMHLGIDSFGNHLTNYFWKDGNHARRVPGVILWGSTQMEAAGYPTNINIGHRLPCGPCFKENPAISRMPRGLCVDPPGQTRHDEGVHACMASITVDEVVEAALKVWNNAT